MGGRRLDRYEQNGPRLFVQALEGIGLEDFVADPGCRKWRPLGFFSLLKAQPGKGVELVLLAHKGVILAIDLPQLPDLPVTR